MSNSEIPPSPDSERDVLENGEDVTDQPNRALILRAVNLALVAEAVSVKVDHLASQLEDLNAKVDAKFDMIVQMIQNLGRGHGSGQGSTSLAE
jgi:hypothetical protein